MARAPFRLPDRYARSAGQAARGARHLWRGLRHIVVPDPHAHEIVNNLDSATYLTSRGESFGRAFAIVGTGADFSLPPPLYLTSVSFSMFGYIVRRDSTNSVQSLGSWGTGWTVQQNYGTGQMGLTIWGAQDLPVGSIGTVPNDGTASTIAVSSQDLGGGISQGLFMLNGRLHSQAHFSPGLSGSHLHIGYNAFSSASPVDTSVYCLYFWDRALSEAELLQLHNDPFLPIRPTRRLAPESSAPALTGTARVTQVMGEILAQPDPALRLTQVVAEVLVPQLPTNARVTQAIVEVLVANTTGTTRARLTQALAEVLTQPAPSLRATQVVAEVLVAADTNLRLTQAVAEVLTFGSPALRVTQSVTEILVATGALTPTYTGQLFPRGSPPPF